jgi:pyrroline-5-carboxylate reductase
MKTLVSLGGGNMAEALVRGWLDQGVVEPQAVLVSDPDISRRTLFQEVYGVSVTDDNADAVKDAAVVLAAVKPQIMLEVLTNLRDVLPRDACVISIAAGIRTTSLEGCLHPGQPVIRVMPNTPALVGRGMSALCRGAGATEDHMAEAERLMKAVGRTARVDEDAMDAVTAISGSGPAYVFGFAEGLMMAAQRVGLAPDIARLLAIETVSGAGELLRVSGEDPADLRAKVTSKGGTTAEALASFEADDWHGMIARAVEAARRRSEELSGG